MVAGQSFTYLVSKSLVARNRASKQGGSVPVRPHIEKGTQATLIWAGGRGG